MSDKVRGGRKLRRGMTKANHYKAQIGRTERNKARHIKRHEAMIEESQERHGGTTASERNFVHRRTVAMAFGKLA